MKTNTIKTHSNETFREKYVYPESKVDVLLKRDFGRFFVARLEEVIPLMKLPVPLEHYYLPDELERRIREWVQYYNHHRYHESLDNCRSADVFTGRKKEKIRQREKI